MTKETYKRKLKKHGYIISGDLTYIDTPYGVWVQKITECPDGFGLISVDNPCSGSKNGSDIRIVRQYTNGNYADMKAGSVVLDYALSCYWHVIANDGREVKLLTIRGGTRGVTMTVSDDTCNDTFCLIDSAA